ncbi:Cell morphogenesis protein PAG1 [Terramyces sp. JEL0728]|nr:Cell morphogenesis protein PAG1 [Terramyces sp. JEL0728]
MKSSFEFPPRDRSFEQKNESATDSAIQREIIEHAFCEFVKVSEVKIASMQYLGLDANEDLSKPMRLGSDAEFDAKVFALAAIAKHCPKLLIDSVMLWRSTRNKKQEPVPEQIRALYPILGSTDLESRIKKRNSLLSNFILCRILTQILLSLNGKVLSNELGKKLEDLIFGQIKPADAETVARNLSVNAHVNWFSELLGVLSHTRFSTISDRLLSEIKEVKGVDRVSEMNLELKIRCTHYLKLKIYPMAALEEAADFLQGLAELFQNANSMKIKIAFCYLFNQLLEPIAKVADAEVNLPVWQKTIESISPRVMRMVSKAKNLNVALPLLTTLFCVSKKEYFLKHWPQLIEILTSKFKDKQLKSIALTSFSRLVWVYLFRCFESPSSVVQKRIDYFTKILFPSRFTLMPSECDFDIFVRIVYFMLVKYPEYGNENVILHLLKSDVNTKLSQEDSFSMSKSDNSHHTVDLPNAERMLIAFRAFLLILRDVESSLGEISADGKYVKTAGTVSAVHSNSGLVLVEGKLNLVSPRFPDNFNIVSYSIETLEMIGTRELPSKNITANCEINGPITADLNARMGTSMRETLDLINEYAGSAFFILDSAVGHLLCQEHNTQQIASPPVNNAQFLTNSNTQLSSTASFGGGTTFGSTSTFNPTGSFNGTQSYMNTSATYIGVSSSPNISFTNRPRNTVVDALNNFTGITTKPEAFGNEVLLEAKSSDYHEATYIRLLQVIIDSIPRFQPSGITAGKLVEMVAKYVLHGDSMLQQSAIKMLNRVSVVKRKELADNYWQFNNQESVVSSVIRITSKTVQSTLVENYEKLWPNKDNLDSNYTTFANTYLGLLDIWINEIKSNPENCPEIGNPIKIVKDIESIGLFFLCGVSPTIREHGIRILKTALEFNKKLESKNGKTNTLSSIQHSPHNLDSKDRLSTFQGGNRASIYKKYSMLSFDNFAPTDRPFVSIVDILVDQGIKLVRDNYFDPMDLASTRLELDENITQRKEHQTKLFAMEHPLLEVAVSDDPRDVSLWTRCYPDLIKILLQYGSVDTLKNCFYDVWKYLEAIHPILTSISSETMLVRTKSLPSMKKIEKGSAISAATTIDNLVEQWRFFLVFAYKCIQVTGEQSANSDSALTPFAVRSTSELNKNIIPFLSSEKYEIRKAAVIAMGSMQPAGYETFLNDIQPYLQVVIKHSQNPSRKLSPKDAGIERMRTELPHLLSFIASFPIEDSLRSYKNMNPIVEFIRSMYTFLSDAEVQLDWRHQITRYYYCAFVERFYKFLSQVLSKRENENVEQYFPFKLRLELFTLFESWSGHGVESEKSRQREANMIGNVLDNIKDINERATLGNKMEVYRRSVQLVSLKALAVLCKGPLTHASEPNLAFDINRLISLINSLLESPLPRYNLIGRSAIENILAFNQTSEDLFERIVQNSYTTSEDSSRAASITVGNFLALVDLISKQDNWKHSHAKIVCLAIFHIASDDLVLRRGASRLLHAIDQKIFGLTVNNFSFTEDVIEWYKNSPVEEELEDNGIADELAENDGETPSDLADQHYSFEASTITSTLPTIYKNAQRAVSQRLASEHPELTNEPWLKNVTLIGDFSCQVPEDGNFIAPEGQHISWTIVHNLFYLSIRFGGVFGPEIEKLWKVVVECDKEKSTEDSLKRRVEIIIDIIIYIAIITQNPNAMEIAKTVGVYICRTEARPIFLEAIISRLLPKSIMQPPDILLNQITVAKFKTAQSMFIADMDSVLTKFAGRARYSVGHIAISLLVDVSIEIEKFAITSHLPLLLSFIFVQLDGNAMKCEDLRMLLVNLIQAVCAGEPAQKDSIDATLAALSLKEGKKAWKYEDPSADSFELQSSDQMCALAMEIVDIFIPYSPNLLNEWCETLLIWGTHCPGNHIACRSLQIFRSLNPTITDRMLSQLLHCLSFSMSDVTAGIQSFAIDILLALNVVLKGLSRSEIMEYPQLFWTNIAILSSVHEWEYNEGLKLFDLLTEKYDFTKRSVVENLLKNKPSKWSPEFDGVLSLLIRGMQSSKTETAALDLMNKIVATIDKSILDVHPYSFMIVAISNFPKLLNLFNTLGSPLEPDIVFSDSCLQRADKLAQAATATGNEQFAHFYNAIANLRFKTAEDCTLQFVKILRETFPKYLWNAVKFSISLLTNTTPYYQKGLLQMLEGLVQEVSLVSLPQDMLLDHKNNWLQPLMELLDTQFAAETSNVIDILLSGRTKAAEPDIAQAVGGAQTMYSHFKQGNIAASALYTSTGWNLGVDQSVTIDIAKKRMISVVKSCSSSLHPKRNLEYLRKPAPSTTILDLKELGKGFEELEAFFRRKIN